MVSMRTIAVFLIACSAILILIAIQKYNGAVAAAKAISEQLQGVEFESVAVPIETMVCGFAGILILVAGVRLLFESRHHGKANEKEKLL